MGSKSTVTQVHPLNIRIGDALAPNEVGNDAVDSGLIVTVTVGGIFSTHLHGKTHACLFRIA